VRLEKITEALNPGAIVTGVVNATSSG